ncbi:MAG: endonuclease, partial [Pseudarthrobacter sp.]|nr:endonuclease [Pseudarthrobacter sp.]
GPTNINNGVLLCSGHHHLIHKEQWTITTTNNTPWFTPPKHLDPHQKPQQNTYFKPPHHPANNQRQQLMRTRPNPRAAAGPGTDSRDLLQVQGVSTGPQTLDGTPEDWVNSSWQANQRAQERTPRSPSAGH